MLTLYTRNLNLWQSSQPNISSTDFAALSDQDLWIDLFQPTIEEDRFLESQLGIEVPTREDMRDIEPSSRLYTDHGLCVMTASLLVGADTPKPSISPVTFILTPNRLCTIRYAEPSSFSRFSSRLVRQANNLSSGESLFLTLLDVITDRLAEVLESHGHSLDVLSNDIFSNKPDDDPTRLIAAKAQDLQQVLKRLGQLGNTLSMARESLVSVARLLSFVGPSAENWLRADSQSHIKTLIRDVRFLTEHADAINGKINFLLDATLGLIDIQQTQTVKILSVASVVFLPPTLIASIFGMNFHHIPGLDNPYGFLLSLIFILLAGIVPYLIFYRKEL